MDETGNYSIHNVPMGTRLLKASLFGDIKAYGSPLIIDEKHSKIISPVPVVAEDVQ